MKTQNKIYIAKIGKAVGLQGELKLHLDTDFPEQFKAGATFTLSNNQEVTIEHFNNKRGVVKFKDYNEYYVIKGDTLKNEIINDLNVKPDMTAHRMAQMFMKKNNAFKTNRVILSRFIDLITENTTA